jgi:cytochrome c5
MRFSEAAGTRPLVVIFFPRSKDSSMSEVHIEAHSTRIRTPGQLITVVALAFLVPILTIFLVVQLVTGGMKISKNSAAMSESGIAARLKPVGEVVIADQSAGGERSGEQIVKEVCQTCHGAGLLNAPKTGDQAAWKPRLAQGQKALIQHAIKGIRSMPPKGGNPSLSDAEVARAVVWMANQSGAKFKEPAPASAPASARAGAPATAPASAAPAVKPDGAHVYLAACSMCHAAGLAGAPKYGDKAAWKPRVAQGLPTLHEHAIKGIRTMPPKGGSATLSDAEVGAAVDYMVNHSK